MILNGQEMPFGKGDANVCRNGGSDGIYNNSSEKNALSGHLCQMFLALKALKHNAISFFCLFPNP